MKNIVFLGNSTACVRAIEELRQTDQELTLTLITTDSYYPYQRDRLFSYLQKSLKEKQLWIKPENFYKDNRINVVLNQPVARINFKRNYVVLENKEHIAYDVLILADIDAVRLPEIKGHNKSGVYHCAKLTAVKDILEQSSFAETIVIDIKSLTGFKTLCAMSSLERELIAVSPSKHLLPDLLDQESSGILGQLLETQKIRLITGQSIEEILGDSFVKAVRLDSGKVLSTEMLILDNIRVDDRLLKDSSLSLTEQTDTCPYLSQFPNVYLADAFYSAFQKTDCGNYQTTEQELQQQGISIARHILGMGQPENSPSSFDHRFQLQGLNGFWTGSITGQTQSHQSTRFDPQTNVYKKIFVTDDYLTGAVYLNAGHEFDVINDIIIKKINIRGIEEQLLEDNPSIEQLTKLQHSQV